MKTNKSIIMVFLFGLLILPMVLAATTVNIPVTKYNYTSITFNCTTDVVSARNMSVYYNATGGATGTYLGKIDNTTDSQTEFVGSISIEALSDLLTYNFTCKAGNTTTAESSVGVSTVGIDNTAASVSLAIKSPSLSTGRTQEITWSSSDATSGLSSTTVTVTKPKTTCDTETWSTASGTNQQVADSTCDGTYTVTLTAIDTASNTATSTATYKVSYPGAKRDGSSLGSNQGNIGSGLWDSDNSKNTTVVIIIIAVICLAWLFKKK